MKKILMIIFVIGSIGFASGNNVEVRLGVDLSSKNEIEGSSVDKLLKKGFEIGTEYRREIGSSGFEVGAGLFYKRNSFTSVFDNEEPLVDKIGVDRKEKGFSSLPLYVTGRYNFSTKNEIKPYLKANLGYSINSGKYEIFYNENETSGYYDIKGRLDSRIEFKNGLYYGIGAGLKYKNFTVDLAYNEIRSKYEEYEMHQAGYSGASTPSGFVTHYDYETEKGKVKNKFVTLSFGYNFQF